MKHKVTFTTKSITFREALWVSLIRPNSESYEGGSAGESRGNILFFVITYHLGQQPLHKMVEDLLRLPGALIYKYKYAPTFPCNPTPIPLPPLHLSLRIVFLEPGGPAPFLGCRGKTEAGSPGFKSPLSFLIQTFISTNSLNQNLVGGRIRASWSGGAWGGPMLHVW